MLEDLGNAIGLAVGTTMIIVGTVWLLSMLLG